MSRGKVQVIFASVALVISLPFVVIHLMAAPDDAPLSAVQRVAAAVANYLGPWGGAVVRLVDFPNAGLRSFSWELAMGLTAVGAALVVVPLKVRTQWVQIVFSVLWAFFVAVWFGVGLRQIADGLL